MKDSKAREMIKDLEHKIGLEFNETTDFFVLDPNQKYLPFEYRYKKIGIKQAVKLILEHLGLELEYIPTVPSETVLKKKEEEPND